MSERVRAAYISEILWEIRYENTIESYRFLEHLHIVAELQQNGDAALGTEPGGI